VTKLRFALWGPALATTLHEPALRDALAEAGAEPLQLNVDDEHVAPAMRIPMFDPPIGAIVSVWTSGPTEPLAEVLEQAADRVAGCEVEERRPDERPARVLRQGR
jgi:hypothetical protein